MKAADEKLTTLAVTDESICSFCPTPLKEVKNKMTKCSKCWLNFWLRELKHTQKKFEGGGRILLGDNNDGRAVMR